MPLTRRHFILTSRDPRDLSDDAFDNCLIGVILGVKDCEGLLFERWVGRSLKKVVRALKGEFTEYNDADIEDFVTVAAHKLLFEARKGKIEEVTNPTGYLYKTAKHLIIDKLRKKSGKEKLAGSLVATTESLFIHLIHASAIRPDKAMAQRELLRKVGEQVGGLTAQQRAVVCDFRDDLDYTEIAERMKLTESTIRVHFHDAAQAIRQRIHQSARETMLPTTYLQRVNSVDGLTALAAVPGLGSRLFILVHLEGHRISEACRVADLGRSMAEAILLHGYWKIRQATRVAFPSQFVTILPGHRHYEKHACAFRRW